MPVRCRALILGLAGMLLVTPAPAEMRGHGGPVRALAISPDGRLAMSGSFDQSAILWALGEGAALAVLRFHEGAVNAVAALPDGRFATGGEDGRIALWRGAAPDPERVIEGHTGPVVALAVSPDGTRLGSAAWDGTARVHPLAGGEARVLAGHQGNVNAVGFLPDGRAVTGGYDLTLRVWPEEPGTEAVSVTLPSPVNAVAAAPDGEIAAAGADGIVRLLDPGLRVRAEVETQGTPVIALALAPDGTRLAAANVRGSVSLIDRAAARIALTLVGPGLPVWSVAFSPDGSELLTGGSDRLVRRWNARTGEHLGPVVIAAVPDLLAGLQGSRGAQVFRACAACHTLTPDGGNRAGPTLHGIFGRRIASVKGYNFSPALQGMDIVWTPETVSALFEIGPSRYTPGTKMPEQTISDPADREALVRFLADATTGR
ncbi:c-type cytochrome [Salinarimonas soli]|uniref:C-type cytochrome n=1 Tax=Salinarimonas soli TaxID=1638099 RepID=A0A5B2VQ81_9HYPH|nr:c-type cytochrome [Salinarimonas soli]KAA2241205.1 c-type cytochrome [Salinarimonas soli]